MSMIGNYILMKENVVNDILNGRVAISDIIYKPSSMKEYETSVDKAWHIIHYTLCKEVNGGEPPLSNVVMAETPISAEDVGYGPARYLSVGEVKETCRALDEISEDKFAGMINLDELELNQIYPSFHDDSTIEYATEYYKEAKKLFKIASDKGYCVIMYIC